MDQILVISSSDKFKINFSTTDYFTVNETSVEPPVEDARDPLNSASALMREATFINQNFSQQVLVRVRNKSSSNFPIQFIFPNANPISIYFFPSHFELGTIQFRTSKSFPK